MPTGYTHSIKDDISFEKFIWQCARGMGALVMMRDEPWDAPIPESFKPSQYDEKKIRGLERELKELKGLTKSEVANRIKKENKEVLAAKKKAIDDNADLREKYNSMLRKVKAWEPPSEDHRGFKEFMIKQIQESIAFDCSSDFDYYAPVETDPEKYKTGKLHKILSDIDYHKKAHAEEVDRTEGRNLWLKQLRESLNEKI